MIPARGRCLAGPSRVSDGETRSLVGNDAKTYLRFILRVTTWVLAAVGIKALDERYAPKAQELRQPARDVLDTAKSSSREGIEHAQAAGSEVRADARQRSAEVPDAPSEAVDEASAPPEAGSGSRAKAARRCPAPTP